MCSSIIAGQAYLVAMRTRLLAITFRPKLIALVTSSAYSSAHIVVLAGIVRRVHFRLSSLPACLEVIVPSAIRVKVASLIRARRELELMGYLLGSQIAVVIALMSLQMSP